jgi:hypothetical protein
MSSGPNSKPLDTRPSRLGRAAEALVLACAIGIGAVWVLAAFWKLLDLSAFAEAIETHGILPLRVVPWLPAIPFMELALGIAVVVLAPARRPLFVPLVIASVSLMAIVGLSAYLWAVPGEAIQKSGCGCLGHLGSATADALVIPPERFALIKNIVLAVGHVPLLVGPFVGLKKTPPEHSQND